MNTGYQVIAKWMVTIRVCEMVGKVVGYLRETVHVVTAIQDSTHRACSLGLGTHPET